MTFVPSIDAVDSVREQVPFHERQRHLPAKGRAPNPRARDPDLQDRLIAACERFSSIAWPD
jgi:hypothetical protein